ncbi:peroxide stress protein YaaA [Saccharothrix violaceirubra]|uniref:Peroxide stress protein YaaA n=1 Tax=Saccharothrix violaceirubra TaxID=413306 RepID=A0A7W7WV09_9PSEU|nr:peroxide stress protein YaaA [Saccharothrix violaceirubra]MBB4964023.1 hypothetical protein [Saccharothrix violaceirubra]
MLVLLPPSETKSIGGRGVPLELDALSFPDLNPVRAKLVDAVVELAADPDTARSVLGLSQRQADEVARNAALRTSPTTPALSRYTGVLYDALDYAGLTRAGKSKAVARLAVASALFGVVRGGDPIPAYRLSGGSVLPAVGPLGALWRPVLEPALAGVDDFVVDLRSGPYSGLARIPGAVVVKVVTEDDSGRRQAVSHFNKAHKGFLARALVESRAEPDSVAKLIRVAGGVGMRLERTGADAVDLVVSQP